MRHRRDQFGGDRTPARAGRSVTRAPRAFTILELLVVVVLMALIASITLPRLGGNDYRAAMHAADDLADLLALFAQRESIGADNVALAYDPESASVMLLELVGDPNDPANAPYWAFDRYIEPIRLPLGMSVTDVRVDGRALGAEEWFIPVVPGQGRPAIELRLEAPASGIRCTVFLPAYALTAMVIHRDQQGGDMRLPLDLDLLGRDREQW
jgi:prepilin-type N-terminal cleavage/methylation domain-containing protein